MFGWCNFYHTEISNYGFPSPCGDVEKCNECSAYENLSTEDNKINVDKKDKIVYNDYSK